jgi:signal transduction protein with GAF and PtsI domain
VYGSCVPAARRRQLTEFQAPKVRRWSEKLHANALPSFARLALVYDTALLFFQGLWVRQDEHLAVVDLVLQQQQAAMRIHDDGFTSFFEFLAIVRAALRLQANLVEGASAASVCRRCCSRHIAIIGLIAKEGPLAIGTGVLHKQPRSDTKGLNLPTGILAPFRKRNNGF